MIRHLVDVARSFIFDTALAPASVAAARTALEVLRSEPQLAGDVLNAASTLSEGLRTAGLRTSTPSAAVVSVRAPSPDDAVAWAARCAEQGVRVGCFRPPSVPDGVSRLRLTARADLGTDDLDRAIKVISESAPAAARA